MVFQWILTKLSTYLVLKRIWNPIDFEGQRSRSPGQILVAIYHYLQHNLIFGTFQILNVFFSKLLHFSMNVIPV
jgi:hypothetical protein